MSLCVPRIGLPDNSQMVYRFSSYNKTEPETIEVSDEQISSGLSVSLQVRRGSESALNQLLLDSSGVDDLPELPTRSSEYHSKRWSAAAPISQEPTIFLRNRKDNHNNNYGNHNGMNMGQPKWIHVEEDEAIVEKRMPSPRKGSSKFSRDGASRLSMQFVGDSAGSTKWADAADRAINSRVFSLSLPRDHRRKEPLTQMNSADGFHNFPNNQSNQYENTEYIVLKMDDEALGIHMVPDYDQSGRDRGLLVQRIEQGGKIHRDGRISVSDRIVEINEKSLLNQPFNSVQEIFRDSLRSSELRLRVVKNVPQPKKQPPPVYPKPSHISQQKRIFHDKENLCVQEPEKKDGNNKISAASPPKKVTVTSQHTGSNVLMAVSTRKVGTRIDIELEKGVHGLGFSITTRDNPVGGNCPIYIKNILPKGAAVQDGRLKCGDRLLSVNGVNLNGKSQSEVVTMLRNVPPGGKVNLVVSRQENVQAKPNESTEVDVSPTRLVTNKVVIPNKDKCVDTKINENPTSQGVDQSSIFPWRQREIVTFHIPVHDTERAGLGISVKGKTSTNGSEKDKNGSSVDMGIFINSIINGGAASRDGRLRTNDQLLNVNGVSLLGQSNSVAMETLRRAIMNTEGPVYGTITLTVARKINSSRDQKTQRESSSSSSLYTTSSAASTELLNKSEIDGVNSNDNSGNSNTSDSTVIFVPSKSQYSPPENTSIKNPVLERLTGQMANNNNNALRNESYYRATHQQTMMLMGKDETFSNATVNGIPRDSIIIEEEPQIEINNNVINPMTSQIQQRNSSTSTLTTEGTYASQLSLDEAAPGFSRDAFGRQSMSEKRHATLDAKSTDTYQRNKKLREERDKYRENRKSANGVMLRVNSTESIPRSDRNEILVKNQLGPALGMKKSSSLESLQTMVQEIQMAEDGELYRRVQVPVRVVRGRGCNESFRAAVDRSYDASTNHLPLDALPEDGICQFAPRQSSLNSQLDSRMNKQQQQVHKKKYSLLKGLGSMFRFGKHRKPTSMETATSDIGPSTKLRTQEEERELARRCALEEQQRIQEQYRILMQRQLQQQQQQQQQQQHQLHKQQLQLQLQQQQLQQGRPHYRNDIARSSIGPISTNGGAIYANTEQLQNERINNNNLHRSHAQFRHSERRGPILMDNREDYFDSPTKQCFRQSESDFRTSPAGRWSNRSSMRYPSSNDNVPYSHYVNCEDIQQNIRRQQMYHSQRRNSREISHRPVSNFYEYESVEAMMENNRHAIQSSYGNANNDNYNNNNNNNNNCMSLKQDLSPSYGMRNRGYQQTLYPTYQQQQIKMMKHRQQPPHNTIMTQSNNKGAHNSEMNNNNPVYSNMIHHRQSTFNSQGPFVTQITITDNNNHYTSTSLGTKV